MRRESRAFHVPALVRTVIPPFSLGRMVYRTDESGRPLYAAEYQQFNPPTLAELVHAYFGKTDGGEPVCPAYRKYVLSNRGKGEWTGTFLRDGREVVERPTRVYLKDKGKWVAEGGKVTSITPPPDGFVLKYDPDTGFPVKTTENRQAAAKVFGEDISYFVQSTIGLGAVLRDFPPLGSFSISTKFEPGYRDSDVGGRVCSRVSGQDAKLPAKPPEAG